MYRHLVCAGDFYSESQEGIHDKQLEKELHVLGQQMDKIKDAISERAKIALCRLRWFKLNVSKCQKDVKCQIVKHLDYGGG